MFVGDLPQEKRMNSYLQGPHIRLRAAEPEDLERMYVWENDTSIWQVSDTLVPFSQYNLRRFLEQDHHDIFASRQVRMMIDVTEHDDAKPRTVGTVDLFDFDPLHSRLGIGILIASPEDRRTGYATETLQLITAYCRDILMVHQVYAHVAHRNTVSRRLFSHCGFEETAVLPAWNKTPEGWEDVHVFQMIY